MIMIIEVIKTGTVTLHIALQQQINNQRVQQVSFAHNR